MYSRFALAAVVLLTGCATTQEFEVAEYSRDPGKYGEVGIVVNGERVYQDMYYRSRTHEFVRDSLRESELFNRVELNSPYIPKQIKITITEKAESSENVEYGKLLLGAATLFMVPTQSDKIYTANFVIECRGSIVASLSYDQPLTETHFAGVDSDSYEKKFIQSSVSKFLLDIEDKQAFGQNCPSRAKENPVSA